jgi:hypothetical protein
MGNDLWGFIHEPSDAGGLSAIGEVILTLTANLPAATALNIQTGAPGATVEGDSLTLSSPLDNNTQIQLNGQEIKRGVDAIRISATQLSFIEKLKTTDQIRIRIFS